MEPDPHAGCNDFFAVMTVAIVPAVVTKSASHAKINPSDALVFQLLGRRHHREEEVCTADLVLAGPGSMAVESWDLGSMVAAGSGPMAVESWDLGCMVAAGPGSMEAGSRGGCIGDSLRRPLRLASPTGG